MDSTINLTFYSLKEELSLQFQNKITIKEMKEQYAKIKKIDFSILGKSIFLIYNGLHIDLNSECPIDKVFKNNDIIYVINKGENITIEKIVSERKNKEKYKPQKDNDTNKNDNNKNDDDKNNKNKDNKNKININNKDIINNINNINNNINDDNKKDEIKILYIQDYFLEQMVIDGFYQK